MGGVQEGSGKGLGRVRKVLGRVEEGSRKGARKSVGMLVRSLRTTI